MLLPSQIQILQPFQLSLNKPFHHKFHVLIQ